MLLLGFFGGVSIRESSVLLRFWARGFLLVPAGSDLLLKIFRVGGSSAPVTFRRARQGVKVVHPNPGTAVDGARHLPPPWGVWVSVQHRSPACRHEPTNDPLLLLVVVSFFGGGGY